jgi:hypothetical protein
MKLAKAPILRQGEIAFWLPLVIHAANQGDTNTFLIVTLGMSAHYL